MWYPCRAASGEQKQVCDQEATEGQGHSPHTFQGDF